jgi:hypothetical protein
LKKVIHVNRQHIAMNRKDGGSRPTLTCKTYKDNYRGFRVEIQGPSVLIDAEHCGRKPLGCGARVWIETEGTVVVDGETVE